MPTGALSLVLHAHLPFVRHPEHPRFLEEDWLFEAIAETYIPLLRMLDRLEADGVPCQLTMSITPPLAEMLADPLLQERASDRLARLAELAREVAAVHAGGPLAAAAEHARHELEEASELFEGAWQRQLLPRFRHHLEAGRLEVFTCTATHGLLPLMATDEARSAQVEQACRTHARHLGRRPEGIWLAECAWSPGLDELLATAGIRCFIAEGRALTEASPPARLGTARPVWTPAGVAAFGRDAECSHQVWSASEGYPGDYLYREFYRDVAWDLPYALVRPYLHDDGIRRALGIKLHRVTGPVDLADKEPYDPAAALARAREHARHFVACRQAQVRELSARMGRTPHLTAPFDAELFGHWWSEGPAFLEAVIRELAAQDTVALVHPTRWLDQEPVNQVTVPAHSTWGAEGTYEVWLNDGNAWMHRHLHHAEERVVSVVSRFLGRSAQVDRALAQACRELLLAQSSDWAFILTMDTSVGYAERRTREHIHHLHRIADGVEQGHIDIAHLDERQGRWTCFPDLDPALWHPREVLAYGGSAVATAQP